MISTHALSLKAGERTLVDKLEWTVGAGECWCIIGRNGAGKSTLLRTLAGLRAPDAGSVSIDGRPLDEWPLDELARKRAYLPQSRSDAFSYRVLETVLAARHPYHGGKYWEDSDDQAIALAALASMEVAELAQRDVRSLSGGERQRVAIAAMLAQDTPLLLLDEPANALDLAHQVSMTQLIAKLCREQGKTAVTIGHDLNLAQQACSHVLLLMGDGTSEAGPIGEVMTAPALSRYLGHPIEIVMHSGRRIFVPVQPAS
jgi:iron complex transport system ATP-binding protein